MGQALSIANREQIVSLYKSGKNYRRISEELGIAYNTVRGICRLSKDSVDGNLDPRYDRCGRKASTANLAWKRRATWLKRLHPDWGAPFIRASN